MCFKKYTFKLFAQVKYVQIPGVNSDAGWACVTIRP